ncbi:hypothetical protein Pfo_005952 [Paulownia fortunei]|nr:hypothetical protein Pfo_005952 [Paulownia fortunei]
MDCHSSVVPAFFICPISLEIMKDPVTISSGMTFDRESIHTWLFFYNQKTCPITKQTLSDKLLTPNSNLLRLIESWLQINHHSSLSNSGKQAIVNKLLEELKQPSTRLKSIRKMKLLIQESDCHRICMVDAGVDKALASSLIAEMGNLRSEIFSSATELENLEYIEEVISLSHCLKLPGEKLKILSQDKNGVLISSLSLLPMQQMNTRAKSEVVSLLKSIFLVADDFYKSELKTELFEGIFEILKDQNSVGGGMAALSILVEILPHGNNRRKAVEAGIVSLLIELLSESNERRACELILLVLESLCKVGGGREALLAHPAGVAAVSSKILRISHAANDRAVGLILYLFRYCKIGLVAEELMEVGGVAKMCMVVQTDCRGHTKDKAREILGFYLKASVKYPCFPSRFTA